MRCYANVHYTLLKPSEEENPKPKMPLYYLPLREETEKLRMHVML